METFACHQCNAPMERRLLMCQACWDKLTPDQQRSYHFWAEQANPGKLDERLLGPRKRQP